MRKIVNVLLLIIVFVSGCAKKEQSKEKVFPVKVEKVQPATIASTIVVAGTVDSKVHTWITAPIEGSIYALKTAEGIDVRSGAILCYIMPSEQQNMLGQAEMDYEQAKGEYENAAENDKVELQERLQEVESRLSSAKRLYKPMPIVSPIGGTVISKTIEIGNNVAVKQPLIEIADIRQLIVKSAVSEDYISKVRLGQTVKIKLHSLQNDIMDGIISVITPGIQLESRTANIEIALSYNKRIKPGMTASIEIAIDQKQNALVVPQDSLIVKSNGDQYLFVADSDTARMVKVRTGIESNIKIEITEGLKVGDKVIVIGQENLKDGVRIKIPESGKGDKKGTNK
jgi:multidrug efflux pump subunit AcrA (membrane-fusion protein)